MKVCHLDQELLTRLNWRRVAGLFFCNLMILDVTIWERSLDNEPVGAVDHRMMALVLKLTMCIALAVLLLRTALGTRAR